MSAVNFTCCQECGRKLHTTFFCQECGRPCCSLDCYCHHDARHAGAPDTTAQAERPPEGSFTRLEPVR